MTRNRPITVSLAHRGKVRTYGLDEFGHQQYELADILAQVGWQDDTR